MNTDKFKTGVIRYEVIMTDQMPAVVHEQWDDGFLAFSNKEIRLADIRPPVKNRFLNAVVSLPMMGFLDKTKGQFSSLQTQKVQGIPDAEGYLMEIDLWRNRRGIYEEISVEREDRGFLYQRWALDTQGKHDINNGCYRCYYRKVKPCVKKAIGKAENIFEDHELGAMEVICPDRRLHFFITTTGS